MIKKGLGFNAITALIMLTTSNCVIAEEYQLPATINNPVVMPVGADGFQNGAAKPLFRVKLVLNSQVHKQTLVKPVMRRDKTYN